MKALLLALALSVLATISPALAHDIGVAQAELLERETLDAEELGKLTKGLKNSPQNGRHVAAR